MARPARKIVITLLVLAVGLIGSAAALYVGENSDSFRRWLEGELSQRTGYAISMDNLRLTLPLRLIASGVTAAKDGRQVLSAAKFNVTVTQLDVFTKTIHRVQVERPVLEIGLAELLKSQPKSETTIALRNLNIVNGRAVINTEDGNQIEIPAINLDAQNINLGGQTDVALRAELPPLGGIADFAIGDFLAGTGAKPEAALAQYAQALIWKPDDMATKLKMADIHLAAAAAHLRDLQYVAAEARLNDARRYTVDPASPQAGRLAELEGRVRVVRGR